MEIFFATDHAGFELKESIVPFVRKEFEYSVTDCGAYKYDESDDYPDPIFSAACAVAKSPQTRRAIILGGSGQGEAMAANRLARVRAAVYYGGSLDIVRLSREHNNANVLSLGARFIDEEEAKEAIRTWLTTPFSEESRHVRRIQKLDT